MRLPRIHSEPVRRLGAFAWLLLAPFATAQAAPWRHLEPQQSLPYQPTRFASGGNGVFWSFDGAVIRRSGIDGSSVTPYRNARASDLDPALFGDGVMTSDGGFIAHDGHCRLQRIEADGRATWRVQLTLERCTGVRVAADGTTWIGGSAPGDGDFVHQVGADGFILARRRAGGNEGTLMAFDTLVDFAALIGGGDVELTHGVATSDAALTRRDADARVLWRTELPGAGTRTQHLAAAADGSADAIGMTGNNLWISRLDAQGQLVRTRQLVLREAGSVLAAQRATDDALFVVLGNANADGIPRRLLRVSADGSLAWEQSYCTNAVTSRIEFAVSGDAVANLCSADGPDTLVRRTAGGQTHEQALPFDAALQIGADAVGVWLVLGRDSAQASSRTRLVAFGRGGWTYELPLGAPDEPEALRLYASAIDTAGNSFLLSQRGAYRGLPDTLLLTRVAADGTTTWRKTLPAFDLRSARLSARHGLVCATLVSGSAATTNSATQRSAFCVRDSDGSAYGQAFVAPQDATLVEMKPIRGGRAVLVSATATTFLVQVSDGSTATPLVNGAGRLHNVGIDDDGHFTLAVGDAVERYDSMGQRVWRVPQSPIATYHAPFAAGADGRVYAGGLLRGAVGTLDSAIWAVDASGATRWQITQATKPDTQIVPAGDAVYVHYFSDGSVNMTSKHADGNGERLWWHQSVDRGTGGTQTRGSQFALSASGDDVVLLGSWGNRLRLERLNAADGRREIERFIDCNGYCGQIEAFALDAAGEARAAQTVVDNVAGQTASVRSLGSVLQDAAAVRVDQPGVAGLWFAPYANGEGLSIDWLPDSRTLFAAWFTYTRNVSNNDPAQQRWFTLQANGIPAGTTELDLPVLQTTGGAFDAGPAVSPRVVGRAHLRFDDCHRATLSYELDSSLTVQAAAGTISLSRLTPATQPCLLADGSTQPGAGARPPSKGFDARLSGAWYDESSVGQGVQLNIQPDGVLFVPWFTYDPQDMANDATQQHWFTLQGNLAEAVNGSVETKLIQTTGGQFDWAPTWNANVVGSATLRVQGCDRATLEYRFDAARIAGPFAGRVGTLDLKRMGGCAP
jgi:hypothetical protein